MLVLTLRHGGESNDSIQLQTPAGEIKVEILAVRNGKVRLGVHCGDDVTVMRKKIIESVADPKWEMLAREPMSSLWVDCGEKDGWHYWQDSWGRTFRRQGRVWQMKLEETAK